MPKQKKVVKTKKTQHQPISSFFGVMPDMKKYLRSKMRGFDLNMTDQPLDLEKLDPKTEILGVFVDSQVDAKVFTKLKKLKLIVTMSTGYDHIHLPSAKKRKIPVCNVPYYGENTVAQHAIALILSLSRKLFHSVKRVKEGVYDYHGLRGFDLKNKTIGIIGTGHIGMHLIDMLEGFEANVVAFDAYPNKQLEKQYNFKYVSKTKLLKESDIISLHVPLFPTTYHMIGKKEIKMMKKGVYIINTARGGLIDPEALVWGLESNHIGGAGIDALEDEQFMQDPEKLISSKMQPYNIKTSLMNNIIIDHPNTIVTPHNAFNSTEALQRIFDTTVDNIKKYYEDETQNDVTKKK